MVSLISALVGLAFMRIIEPAQRRKILMMMKLLLFGCCKYYPIRTKLTHSKRFTTFNIQFLSVDTIHQRFFAGNCAVYKLHYV